MNPKEKIARLEGILARVRERADEPRPHGSGARPTHIPSDAALRAARPVDQSPTAPPPSMGSTPPEEISTSAPPVTAGWSEPPPTYVESVAEIDNDDVEVSSEIVEVDIDIDEPALLMPAESGAQPVSDHVSVVPADDEPELEAMPTALVDEASLAPPPEEPPPANEVQEPAPSSSPRAIASEAYEEESAPRHTPPPESGKQATAPSVRPEPSRKSAPPQAEGATPIGGWREPPTPLPSPASAMPRSPARVPPPPPPPPPLAQVAPPPPPPPLAPPGASARSPVRLTPEVMRADLPLDAHVAHVEGGAPAFAPSTFGDLLDASLGL